MIDIDLLIKNAIKEKNSNLKYLRNLKAKILEFKTSKEFVSRGKEYSDGDEIAILKNMVKVLKKSENEYLQAHREDLVAECVAEREFLENFLPKAAGAEFVKLESQIYLDKIENLDKKFTKNYISHISEMFPYNDKKDIVEIVKQYINERNNL